MPGLAQRRLAVVLASIVFCAGLGARPAGAIVGGSVAQDPDGVRRHTVRIESVRSYCSGALIAPDLVLTAAHCISGPGLYRVIALDRDFRPQAVPVLVATVHGSYVARRSALKQPGLDLAMLRLAGPLPADMVPVALGAIEGFANLSVAGFGVASERRRTAAPVLRQASLRGVTFDRPNGPHVLAIGRTQAGARPGTGACQGDSGGPVFVGGGASRRLIGIVTFAGGLPGKRNACGGITAAIPVAEHLPWINERTGVLRRFSPQAPALPVVPASPPPRGPADDAAFGI